MKHCFTVISYNDAEKTELECALCHQAEHGEATTAKCPYDQSVDVRSDLRVVNHLVDNGWKLQNSLVKEQGLVFVLTKA